MKILILLTVLPVLILGQVKFADFFEPKTLRIDYYHTGNYASDSYSIDELKQEPFWGGSKVNLIDTFEFGKYKVMVYDSASNVLIYSKGFSTLFGEWQTVKEAKLTTKTFSETFIMPYPRKTIRLEFYSRDDKNIFRQKFIYFVNPADYFISPEMKKVFNSFDVINSGDPAKKVDLVIIPEGYTIDDIPKFKEDCKKFAGYLFNSSPFKENKDKFNIRGVEAVSEDSGTDVPPDSIWKRTIVNTSFYTFDLARYLMSYDNKSIRDIAANVPYDNIYILVNSPEYGGGAIYNHYSVCVNNHKHEEYVFVHEFGHGFAGLADEYFSSDVAYENFYPKDIEPWEKNITTLVEFDNKWKHLVDDNIPVPTPPTEQYMDNVGVFEGGGYSVNGVYRPKFDCTMKSISVNNFCEVCKTVIQRMIDFYTE